MDLALELMRKGRLGRGLDAEQAKVAKVALSGAGFEGLSFAHQADHAFSRGPQPLCKAGGPSGQAFPTELGILWK